MENGYSKELGEYRILHKYVRDRDIVKLTFNDGILEKKQLQPALVVVYTREHVISLDISSCHKAIIRWLINQRT